MTEPPIHKNGCRNTLRKMKYKMQQKNETEKMEQKNTHRESKLKIIYCFTENTKIQKIN